MKPDKKKQMTPEERQKLIDMSAGLEKARAEAGMEALEQSKRRQQESFVPDDGQPDGLFPGGGQGGSYGMPQIQNQGRSSVQIVPVSTPFGRKEETAFLLSGMERRQGQIKNLDEKGIRSFLEDLKKLESVVEESKQMGKKVPSKAGSSQFYASRKEAKDLKRRIDAMRKLGEDALMDLPSD